MALPSKTFRPALIATGALFGATTILGPQRQARADEVSPDAKGIVGGALLGAEIVTMTESIAGARPGWAYAVGAIAGAGAGGVGGYFIEQASFSNDGRVPTYMLAGGLALIIPAIVLTLNATRYLPEEGATEHRVRPSGPAAESGGAGRRRRGPRQHAGNAAASRSPAGRGTRDATPRRAATTHPIAARRAKWSGPRGCSGARCAPYFFDGRATPIRHAGANRASHAGVASRILTN